MAGRLARDAPHLDGSEPIGVWFDVAWSVYADLLKDLDRDHLDAIEDTWEDTLSKGDPANPTPEEWGTSERAQQGQAAMFAMVGGMPGGDGGAFPETGG